MTITLPSGRLGAGRSGLRSKLLIYGGQVAIAVAFFLLWDVSARVVGQLFMAEPLAVLWKIQQIAHSGRLWSDVYATFSVAMIGFAIGTGMGVLLPFLLRLSPRLTEAVEPYILATMGIPKLALAPLLILWFGIGSEPKIVIVVLMVFYVIFIAVFSGIRSVSPGLVNMARVLGANNRQIAFEIHWNTLLPLLLAAIKVAIPRSFSAAIVGEFLIADKGLGAFIEHSRLAMDIAGVFAGLVLVVILILLINGVMNVIERRLLSWRPN